MFNLVLYHLRPGCRPGGGSAPDAITCLWTLPIGEPLPLGFEIQFGRRVRGGWNNPASDAVTITHNAHVLDTSQFLCQLRDLEEGEKYTVSLGTR
eukprot:COSAG02_NODE_38781_length_425_cov_0.634969_1_plen_95_part_00